MHETNGKLRQYSLYAMQNRETSLSSYNFLW